MENNQFFGAVQLTGHNPQLRRNFLHFWGYIFVLKTNSEFPPEEPWTRGVPPRIKKVVFWRPKKAFINAWPDKTVPIYFFHPRSSALFKWFFHQKWCSGSKKPTFLCTRRSALWPSLGEIPLVWYAMPCVFHGTPGGGARVHDYRLLPQLQAVIFSRFQITIRV